ERPGVYRSMAFPVLDQPWTTASLPTCLVLHHWRDCGQTRQQDSRLWFELDKYPAARQLGTLALSLRSQLRSIYHCFELGFSRLGYGWRRKIRKHEEGRVSRV